MAWDECIEEGAQENIVAPIVVTANAKENAIL